MQIEWTDSERESVDRMTFLLDVEQDCMEGSPLSELWNEWAQALREFSAQFEGVSP